MLQPLEELQGCNAKAKKSIDMNYSSLPPQLVVFKALKSRHFVLTAVCTMALLANVLAVAFAGLFNQASFGLQHQTSFQSPYDFKFVPINGTIGPAEGDTFGSLNASGAYQGGTGEDQFLIAESNYTRNTSLPAWTDDSLFYLPVFDETIRSTQPNASHYEATTKAVGAELDCSQLKLGNNFNARMAVQVTGITPSINVDMNVTVPSSSGNVRCSSKTIVVRPGPIREKLTCVSGPSSVEWYAMLQPRVNATQQEKDVCMGTIIFAWIRDPVGSCPLGRNVTISEDKSLFMQCRPEIVTGSATIRVDDSGRLQKPAEQVRIDGDTASAPQDVFSNGAINVVGQSNLYLFQNSQGRSFHNDSFADDFINYFIIRVSNSKRITDPNQPVPTFAEAIEPLKKAYSKLFAIWLGTNKHKLFVPHTTESVTRNSGWRIESEKRLFVSETMFIISEAILCTYALVALWVYMRRPGAYLARLPTSIASLIALFAASSAAQDMQGTSHLDRKGRAKHLELVDARYGFGNFIGGSDGRVHIGIEKSPFVRRRAKTTWLEQRMPLFRKGSGGG